MISVESFPLSEWVGERLLLVEALYADTPLRPRASTPPEGAHLLLARRAERVVGCCALCRNQGIALDGEPTFLLGWFECEESQESAGVLFARAAEIAGAEGCRAMLGPLDNDTWHSYRVALPSTSPPFFLDVPSQRWYSSLFESFGWQVASSYHSTWMPPREEADEIQVIERLRSGGVRVRSIEVARYREELAAIHRLSLDAFAANEFYTPISLDSFIELYAPLEPLVDREFVLIAENRGGEIVGFVFAVEDRLAPSGERLVMKSAASSPALRGAGVGAGLMEIVHSRARGRGYHRVIHALMHDSNRSARILSSGAETIRAYRLYRWTA